MCLCFLFICLLRRWRVMMEIVALWNLMNHIRASGQCSSCLQNQMDYLLVECIVIRYTGRELLHWYVCEGGYIINLYRHMLINSSAQCAAQLAEGCIFSILIGCYYPQVKFGFDTCKSRRFKICYSLMINCLPQN
jgi:hypothetical protein